MDISGIQTISSIVKKFLQIIYKSKLIQTHQISDDEKTVKVILTDEYIQKIDIAMLSRLLSAINESAYKVDKDELKQLCYGTYNEKDFEKLLLLAKENVANKDENEH